MDLIAMIKNHSEGISWLLLWAWIALTIFIIVVSPKSKKVYVLNLLLLAGFIYLKFYK